MGTKFKGSAYIGGYPEVEPGHKDYFGRTTHLKDGDKTIGVCRVTGTTERGPNSRGSWISSQTVSWRCETPDGRQWIGRNGGSGLWLNARLAKTKRAATTRRWVVHLPKDY